MNTRTSLTATGAAHAATYAERTRLERIRMQRYAADETPYPPMEGGTRMKR